MNTVIWIMGLSGSGKTATATNVVAKLRSRGEIAIHLDGDDLRYALDQRSRYDQSDREKLALSYARLAQLIASQGPIVVVSSIGLYSSLQVWLRKNIDCYVEVFLDASMQLLISRDTLGIYSRDATESGPVVGKDFNPQVPGNPELHLHVNGTMSIEDCGAEVVKAFYKARRLHGKTP